MTGEKRLIDANDLGVARFPLPCHYYQKGWNDAIEAIQVNAPTVDAVEVVYGEWIVLVEFFDGSICTQCSACGEEYTYKKGRLEHINAEYAKYNYCPNCGAKMDGEPK